MVNTKYSNVQPDPDFDWSLYENGYNGKNLIPNRNVKTKHGDVVYCHEPYAQELYDMMEAHFNGQVYTPKDQITGSIYNVKSLTQVSDHEVILDTFGGMSAVVDMNKEHQFIDSIGCSSVKQFMAALKDPEAKEIILQRARTAKVVENRVSIWEGVRANIEHDFMEQLKEGTPKYGYAAHILSVNNGGYTVDINGVKCFLPGSLAASGPITDFESLVGKTVNVCVVNFSKQTSNFVVSHKKYLELTLPSRVEHELTPGLRVNVRVTGQSKNGLFCAIRDAHGEYPFASLMHRSTMSPDMESSFDRGEFIVGDMFMAYVHRIDWTDDGKYRIVIGDQMPKNIPSEKENEE
jgi:ribosomal protein S1